jgi:glyoxylase-like metal-dependent hydrolase (beta-lactamase superfamily II)/rhodanese-related sulfurtransferase
VPSVATISGTALAARLEDPAIFLLDVREPDEFADWRISGAVNIPLGEVATRLDEVPGERDIVVICAKGARAEQAAAMLAASGRSSRVLEGGMGAWGSTYDTVDVELGGARVIQVRRRGKGCLSYVVGAGTKAVVIDPSLDVDLYQAIARAHGWTMTAIVDTHLHADHLSGGRALTAATGAPLWLSPHDPFAYDFQPLTDGTSFALDDAVALDVSAVAAPGHTQGSTVYQLGRAALFTGDTLFLESVGRPDLADEAESFAHALYRSLHERVLALPDDVLVLPAHVGMEVPVESGVLTTRTLGDLRRTLPALALSEPDFVAWAVSRVTDRPPNYTSIVKINAGLEKLIGDPSELENGPNRCAIA